MKRWGGNVLGVALFALLWAVPAAGIVLTDSLPPANDLLLPFGLRTVGTTMNQVVIITNEKNELLTLGAIGGSDPLSPPYQLDSASCSGRVLSPGEVCILTVSFSPVATGGFADSFDIPSSDLTSPQVLFSVSGSGAPIPVADILVSDSQAPFDDLSVAFGERMVGTTFSQSVLITNVGNAALVLGAIGNDPPLTPPFGINTDNCSNRTLAASESCALTVRFVPDMVGSFTASFSIPSNDPDENPLTFNLSGIATPLPVPDIDLSLSTVPSGGLELVFEDRILGTTQTQTVLISNTGTGPLNLGQIGADLPPGGAFRTQSDNCSAQALLPGQQCTLELVFEPTVVGLQSVTLGIPSDDPDENPLLLVLRGTGLAPEINQPPSAPVLFFPDDGQAQVAIPVTFAWGASADPDGQTVIYKLFYSTSPNFAGSTPVVLSAYPFNPSESAAPAGSSLVLALAVPWFALGRRWQLRLAILLLAALLGSGCGGLDPGDSGNAATPRISTEVAGLTPGTVYYWKVVSDDGKPGGTVESVTRSFRTR